MAEELRNFVYLNESTLNDHLSSFGEGIPQEMVQQSGGETETSGEAKVGMPELGLGAGGQRTRLDLDTAETTMKVLAPYRFQRLEQLLGENSVRVSAGHNKLPERGQAVRLTGEVSPMGLFEFETAISTFLEILQEDVREALNQAGGQNSISKDEIEELSKLKTVITQFVGNKIPLQMMLGDYSYIIPLDRRFIRVASADEFLENREYTMLGRVEATIEDGEQWDPTTVSRILDKYVPAANSGAELRASIEQRAKDSNLSVTGGELVAQGPGCIIHPIGMYW